MYFFVKSFFIRYKRIISVMYVYLYSFLMTGLE